MQREQWFHRAVIYQVDSSLFYDANGDGYGDLAGIRQKATLHSQPRGDGALADAFLSHPSAG